jgi:deazaflavin-dependent oxidoreductase (nitroreductase family)
MAQTDGSRPAPAARRVVNAFNRVVIGLQRVGVVIGPMQVLTVAGRRSGLPRVAPVAVVNLDGERYLFEAYPRAAWVANARAAETATLARGRRSEVVRPVELTVEERIPVLRALAATSPAVGKRFAANGLANSAAIDDILAAAPRITVFRVERATYL